MAGQRTKEAQGRRTHLERFCATEAIERPRRGRRIALKLPPAERTGDLVLRCADGHEIDKMREVVSRPGPGAVPR